MDGVRPAYYSFKIKVWVKGGLSTFISPNLSLTTDCPVFLGNADELVANTLSNKLTWLNAPVSESIYSMANPYVTLLSLCHTIISYEAINEVPSGVLSYPASSCITNPCTSWDIDTSVSHEIPPVTFQIRATSSLGNTYDSNQLEITISSSSDFSLNLDASVIPNEQLMVGSSALFEIDKF